MKYRLFDNAPLLEVFNYDPSQQRGGDFVVPDTIRVDDDNRTPTADSEARCFPSLHSARSEQQAFALKKRREEIV